MKKSYHHGNLRKALVEAAIPVLKKKGVVGLSLRELAISLGVSHGAPYRHFRNKGELLEAVAATGFSELRDICQQAVIDHPQDPSRQLYEAGMGYIFFVSRNPEIADLMFRPGMPAKKPCAELREAAAEAISSLTSIIEGGKHAGVFVQRDTDELVLTSLSAVHGLASFIASGLVMQPDPPDEVVTALGERVYSTLLQGLAAATRFTGT